MDPGPAGTRRRSVLLGDLTLESGEVLPDTRVAFQTWGRLAESGDNAVLVLHALTGDSHVVGPAGPDHPTPGWWPGLIGAGPEHPLDTDRFFVVAANVLGGCRGSTGPSSPGPDGRPWGSQFPTVTVRDQVRAEALLADRLGIRSFAAVVGASMGGMRALEWAVTYPGRVRRCLALATCPAATADQIAWSTPQLYAIRSDPAFADGDYYPGPGPRRGLEVARQIAHATYRSPLELEDRFGRSAQAGEDPLAGGRYAVQSYLQHHGRKLVRRFDANSYLVLTEAMNHHDIGRGRGGLDGALRRITAELTVAVVDSDRLYTPAEGALLAAAPACRELVTIASPHGHDGFLLETGQVGEVIRGALDSRPSAVGAVPGGARSPVTGPPAATASGASREPRRAQARRLAPTGLW